MITKDFDSLRNGYSRPRVTTLSAKPAMEPRRLRWRVVLPPGLRAAKAIRESHPSTAVLVLSHYVEPVYALELLADDAEGVGYLLKDRVSDIAEFLDALRRVVEGGSALDPTVVSELVGRRRSHDPIDKLTPCEREVVELMAEGRSNRGIASRMVVSERAVEKHVTSIFSKLGLPPAPADHRRVIAVLRYVQRS
jgi:DNA-binding NarL/FixJ family response regulator